MKLTAIVLTHNNQLSLEQCLSSLSFADEIVVVDDQSQDKTKLIAEKFKVRWLERKLTNFASQRNWAIKQAEGGWVLMIDADEQVTPELAREIKSVIKQAEYSAFRIKRLNYFFGKKIVHGGYWPDWQTRLFKLDQFDKFSGRIHESAYFHGPLGSLSRPLIHRSHNSLKECLEKSLFWTKLEADEFIKANHPPITWWRILKVMIWEFNYRYFKKLGFLDGYVGLVESLIQAMNRFYVYQQVWEAQQK